MKSANWIPLTFVWDAPIIFTGVLSFHSTTGNATRGLLKTHFRISDAVVNPTIL